MKQGEELISIIVPIYQVEKYIRRCLNSLISQTYKKIEILLIDDGSTDKSGIICDEYALVDDRIKVVHQENRGLSVARNVGIERSKGEYIAFVDSDDWVAENYIEILYKSLIENDGDISQCGFFDVFNEEVYYKDTSSNTCCILNSKQFLLAEFEIIGWKCCITWNKLYKKKIFGMVRFPVGRIHEDEFTTYKLILNSKKIVVNSKKLYFYRHRPNSITNSKIDNRILDSADAYIEKIMILENLDYCEIAQKNRNRLANWTLKTISKTEKKSETEDIYSKLMELTKYTECENRREMKAIFYVFPYEYVDNGDRIVLYGAGEIGKMYYRQIMNNNYCSIVHWVDINYRDNVFPVQSPEIIPYLKEEYDRVVIAIGNKNTAIDIMETLVSKYNVSENKIVYSINSIDYE